MLARLNFVLALALILSGLYLVRISYESRRLFAEIESAHGAERQAQATHLRVETMARTKLGMRAATPANTTYVVDASLATAPPGAPVAAASERAPAASQPDAGASR